MYKRVKVLDDDKHHLTAIEKKIIIQILNNGWLSGTSKKIAINLEKIEENIYMASITKSVVEWNGSKKRTYKMKVKIK